MARISSPQTQTIHATGLVYDGLGLLLRGDSGAGKSLLALHLIEHAPLVQKRAVLVGDDRIGLTARKGRIWMRGARSLAGKIEMRGRGIVARPFAENAPVDLVVDLVANPERMPEPDAFITRLEGIEIARCPVPRLSGAGLEQVRLLVLEALSALAGPGHAGS